MSQQKPRQRGGRVLDKATPEQVMGLARNLPLTHSVLEKALADATPGQLGFLANLFEKENASRAESKRRRLLKQAGFPQSKTLEGYDRGMAVLLQCLFDRFGSVFPQCGLMVFPGVVIVSR
ncbi:hypothetical protein KTF59_04170 [Bifidobacterium longum]|uniref:hypothetical protein n=1 Tax=Bifidobacterium longum TaxID=216816 RepID=UPI001C23E2B2|nr:hypothetical protein [Bifidobacterium longum]MBU9109922.1 hypothetical protein [Bifidobacterium longum]